MKEVPSVGASFFIHERSDKLSKYKEVDEQMEKFAEYYILTGGNALASARLAEYEKPVNASVYLTLKDSPVWELINRYNDNLKYTGIMGAVECRKRMSDIARGKATAKVPMTVGVGDGCSEVVMVEVPPTIAEQTAALKIIGKWNGLDKGVNSENRTNGLVVQIVGEENLED